MFETSQDIFYIVVACSIGLVAIFLCWMIFYVAMILRRAHLMVDRVAHLVEKVESLMDYIREKFDSTSNYLGILLAGAKQVMEYINDKKTEGKGKNKK